MLTTWEGCGTGSGRNRIPSAKLKIAELAPIASARETIAVRANPGFWRSVRSPYRRSLNMVPERHFTLHWSSIRIINKVTKNLKRKRVRYWDAVYGNEHLGG